MSEIDLPPAAQRLLHLIAEYDQGDGVMFTSAPRARWLHEASGMTFNARTFYPLDRHRLIDVGDGRSDAVKITDAGREQVSA